MSQYPFGGRSIASSSSWLSQAIAKALREQEEASAVRRKTFFSFHYQNDINRASIVRQSWRFKADEHVPGFFDASLWEESKRNDPAALKGLIHDGLYGTTVTCVLAGQETWRRPWVRYEIAKSIERGNALLTVHIWPLTCMKTRCQGAIGPNPLANMAVYRDEHGFTRLAEWNGFGWEAYRHLSDPVPWPKGLSFNGETYVSHQLSQSAAEHTYYPGLGDKCLPHWISNSAFLAGK